LKWIDIGHEELGQESFIAALLVTGTATISPANNLLSLSFIVDFF
jgi:hypothetical protein